MKTSVGKTKLEIAVGDITQLEVDAVVAPASVELWMDHGVAAAIKAAGGDMTVDEAWTECVTVSNAALKGE